jgi:hypothetical protein
MRRCRGFVSACFAVCLAVAPLPSLATDPAPTQTPAAQRPGATTHACGADVQRLCGDVPAGGGARARCLRAKQAQASPACQAELSPAAEEGRRQNLAAAQAACQADIEKLCAATQPGGGAIVRCLRAHGDRVSAGCREKMAAPAP